MSYVNASSAASSSTLERDLMRAIVLLDRVRRSSEDWRALAQAVKAAAEADGVDVDAFLRGFEP
jgi:hypothetical protein